MKFLPSLVFGLSLALGVFSCSNPASGGSSGASSPWAAPTGTLGNAGVGLAIETDSVGLAGPLNTVSLFSVYPGSSRALTNTATGASSYDSNLWFALSDAYGNGYSILGYDVYRSTDNTNWTKVARVNLGILVTVDKHHYQNYFDQDPSLSLGTTYYYRIQAFDSTGFSPVSKSVAESFLPLCTGALVPTSYTGPTTPAVPVTAAKMAASPLQFTISNQALWSSTQAQYFYFALKVTDMAGNYLLYGEYRYNFTLGRFEAPGSWYSDHTSNWQSAQQVQGITYSMGTVSVRLDQLTGANPAFTASLVSGSVYQWNIYGAWDGGNAPGYYVDMVGPFFSQNPSSGCYACSWLSNFKNGGALPNGSFQFVYQ